MIFILQFCMCAGLNYMYMIIKKSRYSSVHIHRVLYAVLEIQYLYESPVVCLIILVPLIPSKKLAQNLSSFIMITLL